MSTEIPNHHCPGCGTSLPSFPRYAWHFCMDCLNRTEDGTGKRLEFGNASLSGGLIWRYRGDADWSDAITVVCRIKSRPVMVREARFGGIVVEPLFEGPLHDKKHITDLR